MIALRPFVARLEEAGLHNVEGALEWAGLKRVPPRLPAYFVVPVSDRAARNERMAGGAVMQKVDVTVQVIVVMDRPARDKNRVSDALKETCDQIDEALIGWRHPESSNIATYAGGQLLGASDNVIAWSQRYVLPTRISKQ